MQGALLLSEIASQSQLCGSIVRMLSRGLGKQSPNALATRGVRRVRSCRQQAPARSNA